MDKYNNIKTLFNDQGCLTRKAIFDFHAGSLSSKSVNAVNEHISGCEFCADALEGMTGVSPVVANSKIKLLNKQILEKSKERKTTPKINTYGNACL